ncbi:aldo/keto reductase [Echinicola vietnamensis]|uniref:Putative oxidoreductase, aryl-alcohol dehydrogenase like protein n=1 Tax=Echinicola vietnamensis (strain DSM 17526 / LMG 23754 / KMM 6221) TaxID=926556 RepID=L0FUT0_ECHVK|nr:aldo/keto reductase [Echinicola vietnamensis]AGA76793.1 putative oxidoreductase, aryl-alcohol dehydrogenase like protein [Echinicola vietnamensis DSM 17526]
MKLRPLGNTGIKVPPIVFGTSALGNLFTALDPKVKEALVKESIHYTQPQTFFDSAGKYGAGLALESLGNALNALNVPKDEVVVSNKLGWVRSPLVGKEPQFEKGVWRDLKHDAVQKISYDGILECFEEGNELLQGYSTQLASVHDPDEYLAKAANPAEEEALFEDVLEAYRALEDLKRKGLVKGIGVGAKDWKIIPRIYEHIKLDWVMFANSMTIISHPKELLAFMQQLSDDGVGILNSAVFQSGFLVGGEYYDYQLIKPDTPENKARFEWRSTFFAVCKAFGVTPAHACVQFGLAAPGVASVALSTSEPEKVKRNVAATEERLPAEFWAEMHERGLLHAHSPL